MSDQATLTFLKGQLWFCASVLVCVMLLPEGLTANAGISYYSAHLVTAIPYIAGLLVTAWFSFKAAGMLPKQGSHGIGMSIKALAVLGVIVAAFPFTVNYTIEFLHIALSAILFILELILILWMTLRVHRDTLNLILMLCAVSAITLTLSYLNPVAGYLIAGEVSFQLIFGLTVIRTFSALNRSLLTEKQAT